MLVTLLKMYNAERKTVRLGCNKIKICNVYPALNKICFFSSCVTQDALMFLLVFTFGSFD